MVHRFCWVLAAFMFAWSAAAAERQISVLIVDGGHTPQGTRWPRETEESLEKYVRGGGGLVVFHAANNAFLEWPAYNEMIGLGWRDKSFGPGLSVGKDGS